MSLFSIVPIGIETKQTTSPTFKASFSYKAILQKGIENKEEFNKETGLYCRRGSSSSEDRTDITSSRTSCSFNFDSSEPETLTITFEKKKSYSKDKRKKKKSIDEQDFLNPDWKLPGGKRYQKDGVRLENAFYRSFPKKFQNCITMNVKPKLPNGNVIVEFDMLYQSDSSKRIISFEIKGVNPSTINNLERQKKIIAQGLRQKTYLENNYPDYKIDCIYCFVTGKIKDKIEEPVSDSEWKTVTITKNKSILDNEFIKKIRANGISVAIDETPQQCAKNAFKILGLLC